MYTQLCAIKIDSMESYIDTLEKLFSKDITWGMSGRNLKEEYFENYLKYSAIYDFYLIIHTQNEKFHLSFEDEDGPLPRRIFQANELNDAITYANIKVLPNEKTLEL